MWSTCMAAWLIAALPGRAADPVNEVRCTFATQGTHHHRATCGELGTWVQDIRELGYTPNPRYATRSFLIGPIIRKEPGRLRTNSGTDEKVQILGTIALTDKVGGGAPGPCRRGVGCCGVRNRTPRYGRPRGLP